MSAIDLTTLPAYRLREGLARGEWRAVEVVEAYLDRIAQTDGEVHAYLTVTAELARREAEEVDRRRAQGEDPGWLGGVPVAIKDNLLTRGVRTTAASRILGDFRPPVDATPVARVRGAGAPLLGKTNLDEFAMGSSTENSAFGPTRNPRDPTRVPGGSSGGSAAAVAAGEAPWALGSDTGGSIRQPAALCGVVGLKPTYGRVSRSGLIAFASSLDCVGPIARTVQDCALLLQVLAGEDPLDATCSVRPVPDYLLRLEDGVAGVRIGLPREYFGPGVAPGVADRVLLAVRGLEGLGARVEECSLPHTEYALDAYYVIAPAEASSNLARYDGVRYGAASPDEGDLVAWYRRTRGEGFGREVKRRIMLGTYALSAGYYDAYYLKAQKVRTLIRREFEQVFGTYHVLITPTSPTVAFPLGERVEDPLAMYAADVLTVPVNLAGLPAISVPCGESEGLPVGLQVIGPPFGEEDVLRVARAVEALVGGEGHAGV